MTDAEYMETSGITKGDLVLRLEVLTREDRDMLAP